MADFEELDKLTEDGYLRKVEKGDLVLYNYTDKATYDKMWNHHTLNARGTVYDKNTGRVVAKAFPKFFNWEELPEATQQRLATEEDYEIFDKVDGSLGIIYFHDGEWQVNTRGSFDSEQAVKGKELLKKYDLSNPNLQGFTILAEIVYPENRIILDYGETEELRILAVFIGFGELSYDLLSHIIAKPTGMPVAKRYDMTLDEAFDAQAKMGADQEGFVVKFRGRGERVKIKSKEYLKVARMMSHATPLGCWESFNTEGKIVLDFLEGLPEEFRKEIDQTVIVLENEYQRVLREITLDREFVSDLEARSIGIGLKEGTLCLTHPSIIFSSRKHESDKVHSYILKQIRPTGNRLQY